MLYQSQVGLNDPETEKDFRRAYLKLVQKVYAEEGAGNLLVSGEELQRVAST